MKLTFLGTSASEGYPNAFCQCDNCQRARQLGGPNLRKRCSVLIDDVLLIDIGPDLMAAAQQHELSLATIQYCLQTHPHEDHLDPSHFGSRSAACGVFDVPRLYWYASQCAIEKAGRHFGQNLPPDGLLSPNVKEQLNLTVQPVAPFQELDVGPYRVSSVKANHAPDLQAMLYVLETTGRTLFYATDTGGLPEETWRYLAERQFRFNVVVMDHTFGITDRGGGHMNSRQFVRQIERMAVENLLAGDARIFATHIGHHSNPDHETLVNHAQEREYDVAFDGLVISV
ncbi:hypothetical protein KFU94_64900 [Chloroflexi bacterium TSY]|nr:hypothetical protein [Chloroflexi bacterium TSY]